MKLLLLLAGFAAACAGSGQVVLPQTYAKTARSVFEQAMRQYMDGNFVEAIGLFTQVKRRFPYAKEAVLAELRIADCQFKREQWLEAVDAYKLFIKFHPTHRDVAYAQYQIALCYFKQGPDDWWFLPPSHEKDLTPVHDAVKEVKKLLKAYPGSDVVPKARELLRRCERKLADHELYVARFYRDRGKWMAAAGRLEHIVENLGTLATDPEILFLLATTYAKLGRKEKAQLVFTKLIQANPTSRFAGEAARFLKNGAAPPRK
jgi:outer membrane protein assembly factor BamD